MLKPERRGEYDFSHTKDALVVRDDSGTRLALFLSVHAENHVCVAVDLPDHHGVRTYAIDYQWLIEHLRTLEPTA